VEANIALENKKRNFYYAIKIMENESCEHYLQAGKTSKLAETRRNWAS